jgi:hypothetical protein
MDKPFFAGIASMTMGGALSLFGAIFLVVTVMLTMAYNSCLQTCPTVTNCGGGPLAPSWSCTLPDPILVLLLVVTPLGFGTVLILIGYTRGIKQSHRRQHFPNSAN